MILDALDERHLRDFNTVLIQNTETGEMRHVKLLPSNLYRYNRNLQEDLQLLWNLYVTNPTEFRINYAT